MRFAEDDEMIQTLAPDRPDKPFGKAILPGRGRRYRLVPNAHGLQSACQRAGAHQSATCAWWTAPSVSADLICGRDRIGIARLRDAPAEWSRQHTMLGLAF
jgi:hypothetical protein